MSNLPYDINNATSIHHTSGRRTAKAWPALSPFDGLWRMSDRTEAVDAGRLIAATAEAARLSVPHVDKDSDLIAGVAGQPVERLAHTEG